MRTKAIFGLGNPGSRYAATRHNAGFMVVDALARRHGLTLDRQAESALWSDGRICGAAVRLVKPTRFMNRSGAAVRELLPDGAVPAEDLLVVHDEIDLPFGRIKLKAGGGIAGHRGLASIQEEIPDAGFARLRFGVGRPPEGRDAVEHVLAPFFDAERERLPDLLEEAASACEAWLELGIGPAMNRVNTAPRAAAAGEPGGKAAAEVAAGTAGEPTPAAEEQTTKPPVS